MSSSHVKVSLLHLTIFIIIQSGTSYNIPTAKFGWNQLLELQNRVCQHYCEDINNWNYRSSRTVLFCMLNCPIAFTSTTNNIIPFTTTIRPIISTSPKTLSTSSSTASSSTVATIIPS